MGQVAQLVEHTTENRGVGGSIPPLAMNREWRVEVDRPRGQTKVRSSTGRAPVSKTGGWGFESLRACRDQAGATSEAACDSGTELELIGPHRLTARTPLFQGGGRGSIPREGVGEGVGKTMQVGGCSSVG